MGKPRVHDGEGLEAQLLRAGLELGVDDERSLAAGVELGQPVA
jgi:hypothetical protein